MMAEQQEEASVDPEVLEAANILMRMFNSGSMQINHSPMDCSTVQRGREATANDSEPPLECSTVQRGREVTANYSEPHLECSTVQRVTAATANESGSSLNLRPNGRAEGCHGSDDPLTLPSTSKQDYDDVKVKVKPTKPKPKPKPKNRGNKNIHQCDQCGEIFEYGQQLGGHMRKHYIGELHPNRKKQKTEIKSEQQQQGRGNSKKLKQHANNYNQQQQISANLQQNFMVYNLNQHQGVGGNLKLDLNKAPPVEYEMEKLSLKGEEESKKEKRKVEVDEEKQERERQQLSSNLQQDFMVYLNPHRELGCNVNLVLSKTPLEYDMEKLNLIGEEENKNNGKEVIEERQK